MHAVLVRDGKTATWYLNGEKDTTGTNDNFIGTKSNNNIRLLTGYTGGIADALLNDVRIYDHVLSEFEIKELAKAKILHYTFDNPEEEPIENLWSGGLNIYNNYGVPATLTILDNETFMGYPIYRLGMTVDDEHVID